MRSIRDVFIFSTTHWPVNYLSLVLTIRRESSSSSLRANEAEGRSAVSFVVKIFEVEPDISAERLAK